MDDQKKNTHINIDKILRENEILKRENKYLKKLTNSKRFKFAEKIASGYNILFPMDTKRRKMVQKIEKVRNKKVERRIERKKKKIQNELLEASKGYNKIIVLNAIPWDTKLKQRPHHFANEFKKAGFFVIYLENSNPVNAFRRIEENLVTINNSVYLEVMKTRKCKKYFLTPNNMPTELAEIVKIKEEYKFEIVYDYLDEFHEDISGDLSIQINVWDNMKLVSPILCCATATRLYDELKQKLGKKAKIIMARNAVNVEHFNYLTNNEKTPSDMKDVLEKRKPIIGFYGALAPWIDFELLNRVAKKHPEWVFVYLGIDYNGAAKELKEQDNVYNLGAKDYSELPAYAQYFNCAIIPFRIGEIAKATSPVKLFEYMAAGLPTVCTRDLKECEGYEYVYMSQDDKEFEENIKQALVVYNNEEVRKKLLEQAKENTWTKCVSNIIKSLK